MQTFRCFLTVAALVFSLPAVGADSMVQPPAGSADYAVFRDDAGTICLQAARTGRIIEQGKDASTIVQKAIDLLPSSGGKVYVAAGDYKLEKTVVIRDRHGVHLEGAARGMHGPGRGGTVLWSDRPIHLLEIHGSSRIWGVTVSNLLLTGSGKDNGKAGIWMHGTTDVITFYNVGANNCGIGFHIEGAGEEKDGCVADAAAMYFCDPQINGIGLLIERAHYMKIIGGEFSDCLREGIRLSGPHPGSIQGVKIIGVTCVRNGGAGIFIGKHCDDITVSGGADAGGTRRGSGIVVSAEDEDAAAPRNIILSQVHAYNNELDGIRIDRARHVIISNSICSVHEHAYVDRTTQQAGIRIGPEVEDAVAIGNIAYGNQEKGIVDESGQAQLVGNSQR